MSYIGNQPPDIGAYEVQSFDGGGTEFTLQRAATTPSVLLFIDGVRQTPTDAYSVSGTTLTTTGTTPSGTDNVTVMFMGDVVDIGTPSDDTVSTAKIQDNAVTAAKIATDAVDALETTVVDPITNATDQITDVTAEGLSTGMEAIGEEAGRAGSGALTTLEDLKIGGTTEHLLNKFQDTVGGGLDGLTTTLNDGLSALTGGGGGGQNKVDVEKMSRKGKIKNKSASKLAVNKSKGRARKSLRIG